MIVLERAQPPSPGLEFGGKANRSVVGKGNWTGPTCEERLSTNPIGLPGNACPEPGRFGRAVNLGSASHSRVEEKAREGDRLIPWKMSRKVRLSQGRVLPEGVDSAKAERVFVGARAGISKGNGLLT